MQMFMSRLDTTVRCDPRPHRPIAKDRIRAINLSALAETVVIGAVLLNRAAHGAQALAFGIYQVLCVKPGVINGQNLLSADRPGKDDRGDAGQ